MQKSSPSRIVCLSNVFDASYLVARGETIHPSLSSNKRRDLFRCLAIASGREILVLSSPPKAAQRRGPKWLPSVATTFSGFPQIFCCNWDVPKIRIISSWFFYARHVFRHVRSGDIILLDNYELIYVLAARLVGLFKRVSFLLEYEDGKHLIDRSWSKALSATAEWLGRSMINGAILAHPALGERLKPSVPKVLVPGFIVGSSKSRNAPTGQIRFLYSGSLDTPRGLTVLLAALPHLPTAGWRLDITGAGPLHTEVAALASSHQWRERVFFHGTLPNKEFAELIEASHVGLNCQMLSDPISDVTFPSKLFTYLSANLLVISSKAGCVPEVLGDACLYYEGDSSQSLAGVLKSVLENFDRAYRAANVNSVRETYSLAGTSERLKKFLSTMNISQK